MRSVYFFIILTGFTLSLTNCGSAPKVDKSKKSEKVGAKKPQKKKDEQDVQSIDETYSSKVGSSSRLRSSRAKVKCSDYQKIKKEDWRKLIEAGWSCISRKNWPILEEIATTLSHRHIKAPWGPYYKSILAEKQGDLPKAAWMIGLAERKAPKSSIIQFQKARIAWLRNDETRAFELLKQVIEKDKKNLDALQLLGEIHFRDRQFEQALEYLGKTLRYNNKNGKIRAAMAESYFELGKFKESLSHYKSAISLNDNNADLWMKMGLAFKNLKKYQQAKRSFEQAIDQMRKGRSVASLSDIQIRKELEFVVKKIEEQKAKSAPEQPASQGGAATATEGQSE